MTYFKAAGEITSAFVVRHAEKQNCPPPQDQQCQLTTDGESRAQTLANILSNSGVSAVLSTNTVRTLETANNTAQQAGLNVQTYGTSAEAVQLVKGNHKGQTVLVVGHSNTVPQIIQGLGVDNIPVVGNQFNNMFLVTIAPTGEASLTHLKYEIQRN
jgi:phosphohistidine phosphatase SixA